MSKATAEPGIPNPGITHKDWQSRVDELTTGGALRTPLWRAAFAAVPRHLFVPLIYRRDQRGDLRAIDGHDPAHRETWLTEVYSDLI